MQEVSYDDENDVEEVYGRSGKPRGYDEGDYKAPDKLTMLRDNCEELLSYCKSKGVAFYRLEPASAVIPYANEGERTHIDELKKVHFAKHSNKAAQDDKSLMVDLDMIILGGIVQDGVESI